MTTRASRFLLLAGVIALAVVLRPPVAAVGPLLPEIADSIGLSGFQQGVLMSIPVVCFGLGSFFAPALVNRIGLESGIAALAIMLLGGIVVRAQGGEVRLFVGSVLIGTAIALGNTLLPALIKQDFAHKIGVMTGTYTTVMVSFAALSASIAVPLAGSTGTDWQASFRFWAAPALVAVAVWVPLALKRRAPAAHRAVHRINLWRSGPAWSLALFMGFQSISFYAMLAWLPSLLRDSGVDAVTAGALLGFASLVGIPMGLFLPPFIRRPETLPRLAVVVSFIGLVGTVGLAVSPVNGTVVWLILLGIGQGTAFPLALNLITIRSGSPTVTTSLSAVVQGIGYLMAAVGTYAMGAARAVTHDWRFAMLLLVGFGIAQVVTAPAAARSTQIQATANV